jgi:L-fuconolactonase
MIDAHAHVFRPATVSPRGCDGLAPADRDAPVEDLLAVAEPAGVEQVVLVPLDGEDGYVAEVLAAHPGRFAGVAVATAVEQGRTPADPVRALELRRAHFPFGAVRTSWLGERSVVDSPMLPVLRHLAEREIALWSYLPPGQLPLLHETVRLLPQLRVVLNHLGFTPHDMQVDEYRRPRFAEGLPPALVEDLLRLADAPGVHLMVSGQYALSTEQPPYRDLVEPTRRLAGAFGAERMLWGSDYPWTRDVPGYKALLDVVGEALPGLTAAERHEVFGGTARRLFPGQFATVTGGVD